MLAYTQDNSDLINGVSPYVASLSCSILPQQETSIHLEPSRPLRTCQAVMEEE
jgi:hypothetical protein